MSIFQSMKFRIIALGILLVLAGVAVRLCVALPFAQGLLRDLLAPQRLSAASYVARDIDDSLRERRALLVALGGTLPIGLLQQPKRLASWIAERQRLNPLFSKGLLVLRPDGAGTLAEYPVIPGRGKLRYMDADWFQAALHTEAPVLSKPQRGRASGEPVLIMALPIRDASRHVAAVLAGVAALGAPGFLDLHDVRFGTSGGFLLVSPADHLFVGASDPALVLRPTPPAGVNPLHDRAMAGYRGTGITVNAAGVEELSAMATVPSTGWFVVARTPAAEAFRPIAAMRSLVVQGTLVMMVATIAVLLLLLPRLLRPLTDAAQALREMASGKRQLAPLPIRRQDEVSDLLLGFNHLVARLHQQEAALKASEARLGFLAHHDPLTGLCNRILLEDRLQQALAHARRNGSHFALLFCDLDDFKPINDHFGHETGDAILRQVAARLLGGRRSTDTVARFGGDEFVVLLTDLDDARGTVVGAARQLLAEIGRPFEIDGQTFVLGASIGIALYDDAAGVGVSISKLMSQADTAMYHAKRTGKNGYCLFDRTLEAASIQPA